MSRHVPLALALGLGLVVLGTTGCGESLDRIDTDAWGEWDSDEDKLAEVVLDAPPRETARPALFEQTPPSMLGVLERLDALRRDDHVKGVFVRAQGFGGAWGRTADLTAAFRALRDAKKPVHCHFDSTDNAGFLLLASSCDRISMTPAGWLNLVGVAAELLYGRAFLEKLGIEADFVKMGRYKTAVEPLTEDAMSEASREMLGALLDGFTHALVGGIAKGRSLPEAKVRALLDDGPFDAEKARELGLIDDVGFDDEARQHLRNATRVDRIRRVPLREDEDKVTLGRILEALTAEDAGASAKAKRVAVVHVVGNILDGEEEEPNDTVAGPFVRHLRRLTDDENVRAIVLRVNSPGGSALASDRMWHAVRAAEKRKPVVVSIGDMAASGGYYIAAAGREIYAEPTSLVGSIGVFGGKLSLAGLGTKLGVTPIALRRGRNASWMSASAPFSESERDVFTRLLERTYARFLDRVAVGRKLPKEDVAKVAEGRVMTAETGLAAGLVTNLGGFGEALARAKILGKLEPDAPTDPWPRSIGILEALAGGQHDEDAWLRAMGAMAGLRGDTLAPFEAEASFLRRLTGAHGTVAAAMPFHLEIR